MGNAFDIVREFERRIAEFAGSKYAVATDCCSHALHVCCEYMEVEEVTLPARTYISVPFQVMAAKGKVKFLDYPWSGVYQLMPYPIWDGAKRFKRGMYQGGLHCLSFHIKKHLPIGRGGMILTDDPEAYRWLSKAVYDGRQGKPYSQERVEFMGYHYYMTPEQAARGMLLLDLLPSDDLPDLTEDYPDLRKMPVFQ